MHNFGIFSNLKKYSAQFIPIQEAERLSLSFFFFLKDLNMFLMFLLIHSILLNYCFKNGKNCLRERQQMFPPEKGQYRYIKNQKFKLTFDLMKNFKKCAKKFIFNFFLLHLIIIEPIKNMIFPVPGSPMKKQVNSLKYVVYLLHSKCG